MVELVEKLFASVKAGRHAPQLEVEPAPGPRGRYQIVCGERRWRAAEAAGLAEVLIRIHPHLGYPERLEKQYEESLCRSQCLRHLVTRLGSTEAIKTVLAVCHRDRVSGGFARPTLPDPSSTRGASRESRVSQMLALLCVAPPARTS